MKQVATLSPISSDAATRVRRARLSVQTWPLSDISNRAPVSDLDLRELEALIASDTAWVETHLPILRGATALLRQPPSEHRARFAALGDAGPAIVRANVVLLEGEIADFARLTTLLRRARTRLLRVSQHVGTSAPAKAPRRRSTGPHSNAGQPEPRT